MPEQVTASPESVVDHSVVKMLRHMTDDVMCTAGYSPDVFPSVVELRFSPLPDTQYGLTIYSIADGRTGFNTSGISKPDDDHSRRWVVYIDRGTNFGSAYDNKGAVYAHGGYVAGPVQQNIPTGSIDELVARFHSQGTVVRFKIPKDKGWRDCIEGSAPYFPDQPPNGKQTPTLLGRLAASFFSKTK